MGRAKAEELIHVYDEKIVTLQARLEDRQRLLAEALDKQARREKSLAETKAELQDCQRKLGNAQAYMARQAEKAALSAEKAAERKAAAAEERKQARKAKKAAESADMARLMESIASSGLSLDQVVAMLQSNKANEA